jgi:hypothetical protein
MGGEGTIANDGAKLNSEMPRQLQAHQAISRRHRYSLQIVARKNSHHQTVSA